MKLLAVVLRGDDRDAPALSWAAAHLRDGDILDLVLPAVVPAAVGAHAAPDVRDPLDDGEQRMLGSAAALVRSIAPSADIRISVFCGHRATTLSRMGAIVDLLVVGPDDADAADARIGGCPVVLVPEGWRPDQRRSAVVVPLITDELPRHAVLAAMEAAVRAGAAVIVVEPYRAGGDHADAAELWRGESAQSELLDVDVAALRPAHVPVITEVTREDLPTAFARVAGRTGLLVIDGADSARGTGRELAVAALTRYSVPVLLVVGP